MALVRPASLGSTGAILGWLFRYLREPAADNFGAPIEPLACAAACGTVTWTEVYVFLCGEASTHWPALLLVLAALLARFGGASGYSLTLRVGPGREDRASLRSERLSGYRS